VSKIFDRNRFFLGLILFFLIVINAYSQDLPHFRQEELNFYGFYSGLNYGGRYNMGINTSLYNEEVWFRFYTIAPTRGTTVTRRIEFSSRHFFLYGVPKTISFIVEFSDGSIIGPLEETIGREGRRSVSFENIYTIVGVRPAPSGSGIQHSNPPPANQQINNPFVGTTWSDGFRNYRFSDNTVLVWNRDNIADGFTYRYTVTGSNTATYFIGGEPFRLTITGNTMRDEIFPNIIFNRR
jgi:hypothetical protein